MITSLFDTGCQLIQQYRLFSAAALLGIGVALAIAVVLKVRLRVSKDHYRNLAEATFDGVLLSRDGIIFDCNEQAAELTGYRSTELLQSSIYELFSVEDREAVRRNIASGYTLAYEVRGIRKDGESRLFEVRGKTFSVAGRQVRASVLRDITRQRAEEEQLHVLSAAVRNSPASIVITNREGLIEYVNPAFSRLTGYSESEAIGQNPRILKAGDLPEEFYRELWETLQRGEEWRGEFHNKRKDGSFFWEMASISSIKDAKAEITHFVAVKEDISERKELRDRLEQLAHFDELTALPNRTMFFDRLRQQVLLSRRNSCRFALLFIDLDGFKRINDTYGHEAGDRVLKTVAARLAACVRISDTVGRMGGDEFTLLLGTIAHYGDAGQVAEKIITALQRPITLINGTVESISASVGISVFPDDADDGDRLVVAADNAMYEAKRSGKGSYRFYAVPSD